VAKQRKRRTLAEITEEVRATPPRPRSGKNLVRPGQFNGANELFDPDGRLVAAEAEVLAPAEALQHLEAGALVAHEVCGCGGYSGCQPIWYDAPDRRRMIAAGPPHPGSKVTPTWIDLRRADDQRVLFLHGDVVWGDVTR